MAQPDNRRRFERLELTEEVYCYVAGERLDASSNDISLGGMFIQTDQAEFVELGEMVGVAFQALPGVDALIYLFGRVVRRQTEPVPGVGVHWESAATLSSPGKLNDFFKRLFGLETVQVRLEPAGASGQTRSVYMFPKAEEGEVPEFPDTALTNTEPSPLDVSGSAPAYVSSGERLPHSKSPGAMTGMIRRRELETTVAIDAVMHLESEGRNQKVRITRMDANGLVVETLTIPERPGGPVSVLFKVRVREGRIPVKCTCAVEKLMDGSGGARPGLKLVIRKLEEGSYKGIYERYLKWLHFRTLSGR